MFASVHDRTEHVAVRLCRGCTFQRGRRTMTIGGEFSRCRAKATPAIGGFVESNRHRGYLGASFSPWLLTLALASATVACNQGPDDKGSEPGALPAPAPKAWTPPTAEQIKGAERAKLVAPPNVPPPIERDYPMRVIVQLEVKEEVGRLADGVEYTFWTFGGTVPGSFIRVRQGDVVEMRLANHPENKMPHNIDLHAATGPGGGAVSSFTPPGKETTFSFQALNPGLYVYHCATAPVGMHIANGMYGLILVEPEGGLPKVDREYYVMQGDFYTKGKYGSPGLQPFDMDKALIEQPDYVVFNGAVGALTGKNSLRAKQGETVRLFVGNGGPNLVSSFHVIGEIFDRVNVEGGDLINHNVQTTLIPAGGAAITEMKVDVPGELILVDHAIFRAFNKGTLAKIEVSGQENETIYSGEKRQTVYLPEGSTIQDLPGGAAPEVLAQNKEQQIELGGNVYKSVCAACHMADGKGVPGAFPPLAASDYLNADVDRAIEIVGNGLTGEVKVNGQTYNNVMPSLNLSHEDIANVLTYAYSQWGNNGTVVSREQVEKVLLKK